jgi:phosphoglycolate phosphatase
MTAPLPAPRAVLFDWDDTLVDNWGAIAHALNAAYAAFGMPRLSVAEVKRRATRSMRDSFPEIFGPDWMRARDLFLATFAEHHIAQLEVKPGAAALLDALRDAGVVTAVVSNKNGPFLREEAEHLGWTERFLALVGAGDAPADKPDPAAVALALSGAGLSPGPDVWLVGDSTIDMACAAATGCTGIRVEWAEQRGNVVDGQKRSVSSLEEVQALVSALHGSI